MNENLIPNLLLSAMAIYLVTALIVPLMAGNRKLAGYMNLLGSLVAGSVLAVISYISITGGTPVEFHFLGVVFLIDSFSGFFLAIIAFMAVLSALYSVQYMEHYPDYSLRSYYLAFPLFIMGMAGVVTVDDLTTGFTVSWQLMTIASYMLVRFEYRKPGIVKNANKYLILMELAWLAIIGGVMLSGATSPGASLHEITAAMAEAGPMTSALVYGCLLFGFGMKAGVFPLGQLWLPDAHSIAPSPISSLLSGVMLKTGIYGIIRTFFWMVPENNAQNQVMNGLLWGAIIATFGVITLFIGTVQSMKQSDSKRLLAYSSIGQLGYIIFAIGAALFLLSTDSASLQLLALVAIIGALYHVLNHAVFKGLLFLTSGSVLYATGTKDLNKLGGLMNLMPISAIAAGIASLSIAGVPPFSGFSSKWTIISSSLLAGSEVAFLVIFGIIALFTSAITLSCYVKFFGMTFASAGAEWIEDRDIKEVPKTMLFPKIVLTVLCIIQGLLPAFYYAVIVGIFTHSTGSSLSAKFAELDPGSHLTSKGFMGVSLTLGGIVSSTAVPLMILLVLVVIMGSVMLFRKSGGSTERIAPTWLCGYQDLNKNNVYIDRNMFAAVRKMFNWTGGNVK
jgi:hydrogenase-4 component B